MEIFSRGNITVLREGKCNGMHQMHWISDTIKQGT